MLTTCTAAGPLTLAVVGSFCSVLPIVVTFCTVMLIAVAIDTNGDRSEVSLLLNLQDPLGCESWSVSQGSQVHSLRQL